MDVEGRYMRVDLALFDGDKLLDRIELCIDVARRFQEFLLFNATYELGPQAADIVLSGFPASIDLKTITLDMPIHTSTDWESIDLGRYTLAFWCRSNSQSVGGAR
jgi:hypothetical protein